MVKKLKVTIGGHRDDAQVAYVNDSSRPTEIDTDLFVGRVSVFVRDFAGISPDGQGRRDHPYFHGRSRAFGILIEGRFKHTYNGDEIQFGTDFDYLPESFPRTPFNVGMSIAQRVDPATHYQEHPPSGRPYIMSPYLACMNTLCAYPAPEAISRALVIAHHDAAHPDIGVNDGFVPLETIERDEGKKVERAELAYWRFLGLRGTPTVDQFLDAHKHLLEPDQVASSASKSASRPGMRARASTHLDLGTSAQRSDSLQSDHSGNESSTTHSSADGTYDESSALSAVLGAPIHAEPASGTTTPPHDSSKGKKKSRFSLSGLMGALPGSTSSSSNNAEGELHAGDLTTADKIAGHKAATSSQDQSAVERQLGPWRFADSRVDAVEDSTFVFLDPTHTRTVAQRRKHFVADKGKHRRIFTYDPDVVYTASFFTPFADLNTFTVSMGPVHINIAQHFEDMPIRYTLRSTRMVPRRDGKPGEEEETFATIAFQLVDE